MLGCGEERGARGWDAPPASLVGGGTVLAEDSVPWSIASASGEPFAKRGRPEMSMPDVASPMASGFSAIPATESAPTHSGVHNALRPARQVASRPGGRMDAFLSRLGETRALEAARAPETQAARRARLAALVPAAVLAKAPVLARPDADACALRVLAAPGGASPHQVGGSTAAIGRRAFVPRARPSTRDQLHEALIERERQQAAALRSEARVQARPRVAVPAAAPEARAPSSEVECASSESDELRTSEPDVSGDDSPPRGAEDLFAVLPRAAARPPPRRRVLVSSGDESRVCRLAAILSDDDGGADVGLADSGEDESSANAANEGAERVAAVALDDAIADDPHLGNTADATDLENSAKNTALSTSQQRSSDGKRAKSIYVDAEASESDSAAGGSVSSEDESGDDAEIAREMALSGFVADDGASDDDARGGDSHRALALRMAAEHDEARLARLVERFLPAAALEDVGAIAGLRRKYACGDDGGGDVPSAAPAGEFARMLRETYGAAAPSSEPDAFTSELTDREHALTGDEHSGCDDQPDSTGGHADARVLCGFGVPLPSVGADARQCVGAVGRQAAAAPCASLISRLDALQPAVADARPRAQASTFVTLTERPDVSRR